MNDAVTVDRLQFAFTVTFHYIFPQLTMGLSLLILILKWRGLATGDSRYDDAARFWARIFALNFFAGVITGIPMEFQFGTNWARFSRYAGSVIGQTLAMEGIFSFFLESSFLGLFLFGERRLGRRMHFVSSLLVFAGSWLSGFLIVQTDAWMQHPVGFTIAPDGSATLTSFTDLLFNRWGLWQYAHTMAGSVVTASFAMASVGAYYLLTGKHGTPAILFVRLGVSVGLIASILVMYPTGDMQGKNVAAEQPPTLAAMEGLFKSKAGAELILIGQPDMEKQRIDNPLHVPKALSFLTYSRWEAEVRGLDAFPPDAWPDNIPLLYYVYHMMVGLGTIFAAILAAAAVLLWRGALARNRWILWALLLAFPFPFIANTAGWMTAELGRQPWLVYGLFRTVHGASPTVSAGNGLFTLLGFLGIYLIVAVLYLILVLRMIGHGPETSTSSAA
ncbi:MAG TPA: cytochrome ubiquinol oxidase subunit I [Bacteroidota bacterium]|nr:cytochrome ubiquinol oxidase subunit I [Bacteroidota bacterium]